MYLFISFEVGEGTGKTTQAARLCDRIRDSKKNLQALYIHEPGTTDLGLHLRALLKGAPWGNETISHGAELFMFLAARAELVAKVIKPALLQPNAIIVADRFADSTTAYQGYGRNLPRGQVGAMNKLASQGVKPHITFLLDCMPEEGLRRKGSLQIRLPLEPIIGEDTGRMDDEANRRFEGEPLEFHERVRQGYLKLAKREPERWVIVDASKPANQMSDMIWQHIQPKLPGDYEVECAQDSELKASLGLD